MVISTGIEGEEGVASGQQGAPTSRVCPFVGQLSGVLGGYSNVIRLKKY
jgi:hypothetical protein